MSVKIAAFPPAASPAALKKIKVTAKKVDVAAAWTDSLSGSTTVEKSIVEMRGLFEKIERIYADLAAAIKSKGDVVAKYQALDTAFKHVDSYQQRAKEFRQRVHAKAAEVKKAYGEAAVKKLIAWYTGIGDDVAKHAAGLEAVGESLASAAEKVDVAKIADLKWDLNEWDLTHTMLKVHGYEFDHLESRGEYRVMVTVAGRGGAEASENATLRQEFFDAAFEAGKREADWLGDMLQDIDGKIGSGKVPHDQSAKIIAAAYTAFEKRYNAAAEKAVQQVWDVYCKDKKDHQKYKLKCRLRIVGKAVGTGVGITTTVAAGWTGVGTIMGAGAAIKNGADLLYTIKDAWQKADSLRKDIDKDLDRLKERFEDPTAASALESGGLALQELTGIRTNTVSTVKGKVADFGSKLQGLHVTAVKLGKQIDKAHSEIKGLRGKLRKGKADTKQSPKVRKALEKAERRIDRLEEMVNSVVARATTAASDSRTGKELIVGYAKTLKQLEGDINGAAKAINTWVIPAVKFAFVSDASGAILTAGSVVREYTTAAADLTEELEGLNKTSDLAGDVTVMIKTLVGK